MLKHYVKKVGLASSRKKKYRASGENIMALTVFGLSALTKGAFGAIVVVEDEKMGILDGFVKH